MLRVERWEHVNVQEGVAGRFFAWWLSVGETVLRARGAGLGLAAVPEAVGFRLDVILVLCCAVLCGAVLCCSLDDFVLLGMFCVPGLDSRMHR
jgi:hypothetical protein